MQDRTHRDQHREGDEDDLAALVHDLEVANDCVRHHPPEPAAEPVTDPTEPVIDPVDDAGRG